MGRINALFEKKLGRFLWIRHGMWKKKKIWENGGTHTLYILEDFYLSKVFLHGRPENLWYNVTACLILGI